MKRTTILIILILATVLSFAENPTMPRVAVPSTASNRFGGPHVAYTDNVYALFNNPAAIVRFQERSFFNLSPSIMNPQATFGLIKTVTDMMGSDNFNLGSALDPISERDGRIALGMEFKEFPFSFAWVADGFGFALMNYTFLDFEIKGAYVDVNIYEDVMLPVGFGFKIFELNGHTVDAGVTVKPFLRVMGKTPTIDIISLVSDADGLMDDLSVPLMIGTSVDLGFMYRWDFGLQAGLTFNDIIGKGWVVTDLYDSDKSSGSYNIPFSMNLGVAYDFRPGNFWPELPKFVKSLGLTFAFDWHNFNNAFNNSDYTKRNSALDIGMGLQLSMWDTIFVSVGLNEMLPAFGLGFYLGKAVKIDLAYYGREFGIEPGHLSTAMLDLSIAIRPGAKERDWPWARKSVMGAFGIGD